MAHYPQNFYLYAAAIGTGVSGIWVGWLLIARALFRTYGWRPGYLFSIFQVVVVLALMRAAMAVQHHCVEILGSIEPADIVFFRRIWILVWIIAMVSSINIFLDIRRMATPSASTPSSPVRRRPTSRAGFRRLRRIR